MNSSGEYVTIEEGYQYNDTTDTNRFVAFKNPFRYRSYYYDFETGLYYLDSRYYDPEIGRFINADSLSYLDKNTINGLNLYAYCLNNPIMLVDNEGTSWLSRLWKGIKNFFKKSWDIIVGTVISAGLIFAGFAITFSSAGFLKDIGAGLIGAGVGSFIGGLQSELNGGSYWSAYLGGAVSGFFTGFGASIGPVAGFIEGFLGNFAGTLTTDAINGEIVDSKHYWFNLAGESLLLGLITVGSSIFGNATDLLKNIGLSNLYIAATVWAEFMFSGLFDKSNTLIHQLSDYIKRIFNF